MKHLVRKPYQADATLSLLKACQLGLVPEALAALDRGAALNACSEHGWTPLHLAGLSKNAALCTELIAQGADVESKGLNDRAWTPLHWAAVNEVEDSVRALLQAGARPDPRDTKQRTPLMLSGSNRFTTVAELLIAAGADVNARDESNLSSLHEAAGAGRIDTLDLLIRHGADVNASSIACEVPLHAAARENQCGAIILLLEHGAQSQRPSAKGQTPMDVSILKHDESSMLVFLAHGALLQTPKDAHFEQNVRLNPMGLDPHMPALHAAAKMKRARMAPQLLKLLQDGADPDLRYKGQTAFDVAKESRNHDIVALLDAHKAQRAMDDLLKNHTAMAIHASKAGCGMPCKPS